MPNKAEYCFTVDFMLGRLARRLRALGFDTAYVTARDRYAIILGSRRENCYTLTRDTRLAAKRAVRLLLIEDDHVDAQLRQVVAALRLEVSPDRLFTRCTECNEALAAVTDAEEVRACVPAHVFETHDAFTRCTGCGKIYWTGTHRELLMRDLERAGVRFSGKCKIGSQKDK